MNRPGDSDQRPQLRLSQLSRSAGSACKLAASELAPVLRHLVPVADPDVLLGAADGDNAAVYRIDSERAIVASIDIVTPIVDDPFEFGRIAAANALADVYAMGARPLFALDILAFPRRLLDAGMLADIVRGVGEAAREAGIAIVGGHSIDDEEPKFGLCVIGDVHPERMVRIAGARAGDVLVLTKPLGTGVIAAALKREAAPAAAIDSAMASMTALNRAAADAMTAGPVHAATGVAGFGLIGHLGNMLRAGGLGARLDASAVPLLPHALELVGAGHTPGATKRNQADAADVNWHEVDEAMRVLLCDAQTSGGLLIAVPAAEAEALVARLRRNGTTAAAVIGQITATAGLEVSPP